MYLIVFIYFILFIYSIYLFIYLLNKKIAWIVYTLNMHVTLLLNEEMILSNLSFFPCFFFEIIFYFTTNFINFFDFLLIFFYFYSILFCMGRGILKKDEVDEAVTWGGHGRSDIFGVSLEVSREDDLAWRTREQGSIHITPENEWQRELQWLLMPV